MLKSFLIVKRMLPFGRDIGMFPSFSYGRKDVLNVLSHQNEWLSKQISIEVQFPLSDAVEESIDAVIDSLRYNKGVYEKKGVAIAANQVGVNLRFFCVADFSMGLKNMQKRIEVICNPSIVHFSEETDVDEEGCLSIPELMAHVRRSKVIRVQYKNIRGDSIEKTLEGFAARVFQHELDHLNGVHMLKRAEKIEDNPLFAEYMEKQKLGTI